MLFNKKIIKPKKGATVENPVASKNIANVFLKIKLVVLLADALSVKTVDYCLFHLNI